MAVDQIKWTHNAEKAILDNAEVKDASPLKAFVEFSNDQIQRMVGLIRQKLHKGQRVLMSCLCVLDVHGKEIMERLEKYNTISIADFEWTK